MVGAAVWRTGRAVRGVAKRDEPIVGLAAATGTFGVKAIIVVVVVGGVSDERDCGMFDVSVRKSRREWLWEKGNWRP